MQDVYKSLTLGGGSLLGEMPHAAGDSLKIQFELKNTSTLELYPPTVMQQNGAFRLVGDYQFWIEQLRQETQDMAAIASHRSAQNIGGKVGQADDRHT